MVPSTAVAPFTHYAQRFQTSQHSFVPIDPFIQLKKVLIMYHLPEFFSHT